MLKTSIRPNVINRQALVVLEKQDFVDLRKLVLVLQLLDSEIYKNGISSVIANWVEHFFFIYFFMAGCENACCKVSLP